MAKIKAKEKICLHIDSNTMTIKAAQEHFKKTINELNCKNEM